MRRFVAFVLFVLVVLPVIAVPARAQELMIPASELTAYVRMLELQGKATNTPLVYWGSSTAPRVNGLTIDSSHVWSNRYRLTPHSPAAQRPEFRLLDPRVDLTYNSAFPRTTNDGAAWAGRGLSGVLRGGAELRWGRFTARLYPSLVYAQNSDFTLGVGPANTRSPYAYPWEGGIDFPQRFGTQALAVGDWGQSGIRFDAGSFTAGFSTENLWWGPGYRNAIIMGSAAPGMPHVDLGTGAPIRTGIGDLEVRAIWGQLTRSNYVGASAVDGKRLLDGLTIGYRPNFLPGLTLGLTRVLYHNWSKGGVSSSDLLDAFSGIFNRGDRLQPDGTLNNDQNDQLASVTARWLLPQSGAEFYVEFARNDFAGDITDLVLQPDHSRAYTAGFQKTLAAADGALVLRGENTVLGQTGNRVLRNAGAFYQHSIVTDGYTNKGQLLGAAIGPGSNSQYLGLDRYTAAGRYGLYIERIRYDDDYSVVALSTVVYGYISQQVDLIAGFNFLRFSGALDWGGALELTRQLNRNFIRENNVTNVKLSFNLGWHRDDAPSTIRR